MSNLSPISANIVNLLTSQAASATGEQKNADAASFANVLSDAMRAATLTDQVDKASSLELLAGEADSLSGLMIDAQKAELSLNLALQLRSKVLDAYKEIMGMQV